MRSRLLPAVTIGALSALLLTACSLDPTPRDPSETPSASSGDGHGTPHWTYEGADGPARWGSLSNEFRQCSAGRQQSPVDLPRPGAGTPLDLTIEHGVVGEDTANNGHTVQMTFLDGESTIVDGVTYHLRQVHFHAESEHTVAGEEYPVEFHFVHADDAGNLMVLGIFGEEGRHNSAYDAFVRGAITDHGDGVHPNVDVGAMLPVDHAHWSYEGSLTTPPCTEGVRWIVLETPVELSEDQLAHLEDAFDDNHRPTQPLNGRTVQN